MEEIIFGLLFVFGSINSSAQVVSNIRAEQRGQDIVVFYSLETTSPCEVSLLLSQDNGVTWSTPLKNVSGDVGKNIASGEKQITWKVLEEQEYLVGDNMKFKAIANGRKSFEPEMVFVEGGSFQMGCTSGNEDETPVHSVTLNSFNIGKYEVTQAQWKAVKGKNPSRSSKCDSCPVEFVTWIDVQDYIERLNVETGKNYRLPTEAEWEYAAKGGENYKGYIYSGSNDINSVAWYQNNCGGKTHPIGLMQANELGIYDMSGNVWEWCSDWYDYYPSYSETNPRGLSGKYAVIRGGGWNYSDHQCRVSNRGVRGRDDKYFAVGVRLVLVIE
jgi:formylglycine-generating enzyme required for sulfatase activity